MTPLSIPGRVAGGRWLSPADAGDETPYPNHRHLDDLAGLASTAFDVVVVGGGGAGAVAAIEAADRGASVVILEAAAFPGGNTQVSGGTLRLIDDRAKTTEHLLHLAQGATPAAVIEAFVAGLAGIRAWVEAHGGALEVRPGPSDPRGRMFPLSLPGTSFPYYPGGEGLGRRALVVARRQGRENGAALWDLLAENLARRDVPMVVGAHARRLLTDSQRRVTGVEVDTGSGACRVDAARAVILACGGFAYDNELMTQYYGLPLPTVCLPGRANGDGVRLALDVGADLWHMNAAACSVGYRLPGLDAGIQAKMPDYGFVLVDQRARRYVCETSLENHSAIFAMTAQDPTTGEFLRTPSSTTIPVGRAPSPTCPTAPTATTRGAPTTPTRWSGAGSERRPPSGVWPPAWAWTPGPWRSACPRSTSRRPAAATGWGGRRPRCAPSTSRRSTGRRCTRSSSTPKEAPVATSTAASCAPTGRPSRGSSAPASWARSGTGSIPARETSPNVWCRGERRP